MLACLQVDMAPLRCVEVDVPPFLVAQGFRVRG